LDRRLRRRIEREHIRRADAVVTVCDSIADHLAAVYEIPRPIVVMNAPNTSGPQKFERDLRADIGIAREVPLAVYVGKITVGRGIEQCIAALVHWPEGHLALVGPVHLPTLTSCRELARSLSVTDRVHFVPPVAPEAVVAYVGAANISVVPIQNVCLSYYYCLPNKLIESALAHLPVAVSDLPELRRFVELSASGEVMDQTDPINIARTLRHIYQNRDRYRLDTERLRKVEKIYGWATQRDNLTKLYGLLESSAPRPFPATGEPAVVRRRVATP
jgi:glycosyltransferase involved in cell wall biosynthesis